MFNKLKDKIKNAPKEEDGTNPLSSMSKDELIKRVQNLDEELKLIAEMKRGWQQNFTVQLEAVEKERDSFKSKMQEYERRSEMISKLEETIKRQEEQLKGYEDRFAEILDQPSTDNDESNAEATLNLRKKLLEADIKSNQFERERNEIRLKLDAMQEESEQLKTTITSLESQKFMDQKAIDLMQIQNKEKDDNINKIEKELKSTQDQLSETKAVLEAKKRSRK
eukprot:TRINITY_DN4695_c0_g1_i1.p1 TRINITY_DN4695_c0_g1~~TRINITY_DN4695_c0_g1_i1.p1  ORF type:complete len:223 (+),score=75.48 TRINITY_DN4695_c0_g1_i1:36-704(+)